jgi:adenylosuccinate lyase
MINAISPIDGRYAGKTKVLQSYFSEFALIKYRVLVEIEYFLALKEIGLPQLKSVSIDQTHELKLIVDKFSEADALKIKTIEATTNHDVKAVEYFIKEAFDDLGMAEFKEFIHFGLTSQDINNTAFPLMIKDALTSTIKPAIQQVINRIIELSEEYRGIPMLARTHGQPASPTTLGKEFGVFVERLTDQLSLLNDLPIKAKFGGATGNLNAHKVTFPDVDWKVFADSFVRDKLHLERSHLTTQIAHYDHLAAIFDTLKRINVILIDMCRDIWTYISMEYFGQKVIAGEVGSSAMPHKVNPIDFENAEGNLGMANAIFSHLSEKLPISRLQRDLTDSTVLRNVGVPLAHSLIAYQSILKGMSKIVLKEETLRRDLENNWAVVSEAIQNILRREGYPKPYEALKSLTRGNQSINMDAMHRFIDTLQIGEDIKVELKNITPWNYLGYF